MPYAVIETDLDQNRDVVKEVVARIAWMGGQFELIEGPEEVQQMVDTSNAIEGWNTAAPPERERDSVVVKERGEPKPEDLAAQDLGSMLKRAGYQFTPESELPSDLNGT